MCVYPVGYAVIVFCFLQLVTAAENCNCSTCGNVLRADGPPIVPINDFYCQNITKGETQVDWKTSVVELPKQHIDKLDTEIVVDYFVNWPYYLKGMKITVCNTIGHRPNISWPKIGYSPVTVHCSFEDFPRCPVGLEILTVQYQSWWPWN